MKLLVKIKQTKEPELKVIPEVDSYYFSKNYLEIRKNNRKQKQYFKLTTVLEVEEA